MTIINFDDIIGKNLNYNKQCFLFKSSYKLSYYWKD